MNNILFNRKTWFNVKHVWTLGTVLYENMEDSFKGPGLGASGPIHRIIGRTTRIMKVPLSLMPDLTTHLSDGSLPGSPMLLPPMVVGRL
jgi:hypothetical protein